MKALCIKTYIHNAFVMHYTSWVMFVTHYTKEIQLQFALCIMFSLKSVLRCTISSEFYQPECVSCVRCTRHWVEVISCYDLRSEMTEDERNGADTSVWEISVNQATVSITETDFALLLEWNPFCRNSLIFSSFKKSWFYIDFRLTGKEKNHYSFWRLF